MAELLAILLASPATWGAAGATIYAAPRWLACQFGAGGPSLRCASEAAISLITGILAAAAFAPWVLGFLHQKPADLSAIAAMIGLLANPTAPKIVDRISTLAANLITDRATKSLKGDNDEP